MVEPKEHWISKAEKLKKEGKFEEAVKILDKVQEIENEEREEDFWYKKAIHFCEIAEYDQALESLFKDLEVNQKSYDTFFLLGKILFKLKRFEESLEYYNKASEEFNRQFLRTSLKIEKMKNVRKFEEAVKYSDLINRQKQLDHDFWYHKGLVLFNLRKYSEAASCFSKDLEINQNQPSTLYELAKSELWAGNKKKSIEILNKICNIAPDTKEKLRIDKDFEPLSNEKQFQLLTGL